MVSLDMMKKRTTDLCRLSIGSDPLSIFDRHKLFCQTWRLLLYGCGQFPDYYSLKDIPIGSENPIPMQTTGQESSRKKIQFLHTLSYLEQNLLTISNHHPVYFFLILIGNVATHPKRALLLDMSDCSEERLCGPAANLPNFSEFHRTLMQHPFYSRAVNEEKLSRIHLYLCGPKTLRSTVFLPKVNFRLSDSCPVHVIQTVVNCRHSLLIDDAEVEDKLCRVQQVLYNCPSELLWFSSSSLLSGVKANGG